MQFPLINELFMHGVFDRGIPNQERIVLRAQIPVNLAAFALILTVQQNNSAIPLADQFFWFGDIVLEANTWIFIYTGCGSSRITTTSITNEPAYVLHWNRGNVIFHQESLHPTLIRIDAATNIKNEVHPLLPNF
jgi:hypothetical protein